MRDAPIQATVEAIYQAESRLVLATLIRLLGDFNLAEEALPDASTAAVAKWPQSGVPASTGKPTDRMCRTAGGDQGANRDEPDEWREIRGFRVRAKITAPNQE